MTWISSIERSESHVRARFKRRLSLTIKVKGAISTITCSKLLAGDGEGAITAIPDEYASARCTDKDLRVRDVIDLNLIAVVEEKDLAFLAVVDHKWLTFNGAWILREDCILFVTERELCFHLMFVIEIFVREDRAIRCNEPLRHDFIGDATSLSVRQAGKRKKRERCHCFSFKFF